MINFSEIPYYKEGMLTFKYSDTHYGLKYENATLEELIWEFERPQRYHNNLMGRDNEILSFDESGKWFNNKGEIEKASLIPDDLFNFFIPAYWDFVKGCGLSKIFDHPYPDSISKYHEKHYPSRVKEFIKLNKLFTDFNFVYKFVLLGFDDKKNAIEFIKQVYLSFEKHFFLLLQHEINFFFESSELHDKFIKHVFSFKAMIVHNMEMFSLTSLRKAQSKINLESPASSILKPFKFFELLSQDYFEDHYLFGTQEDTQSKISEIDQQVFNSLNLLSKSFSENEFLGSCLKTLRNLKYAPYKHAKDYFLSVIDIMEHTVLEYLEMFPKLLPERIKQQKTELFSYLNKCVEIPINDEQISIFLCKKKYEIHSRTIYLFKFLTRIEEVGNQQQFNLYSKKNEAYCFIENVIIKNPYIKAPFSGRDVEESGCLYINNNPFKDQNFRKNRSRVGDNTAKQNQHYEQALNFLNSSATK